MSFLRCKISGSSQIMSYYRTDNPASWIGRNKNDKERKATYNYSKIEAYKAFDGYSGGRFHEAIEQLNKKIQFSIFNENNDVKNLKTSEMKEFYDKLGLKRKISVHLFHYFPFLEKKYHEIIAWRRTKK